MTVVRVLLQAIAILVLLVVLCLLPDLGDAIHGWKGWALGIAGGCAELLLLRWIHRPHGIFAKRTNQSDESNR